MVEMSRMLQSVNYIVNAEGKRSAVVVGINEWKQLLEWLGRERNMPDTRDGLTQINIERQQLENGEALKRDEIPGGSE